MPTQESAVMNDKVTGKVNAKATKAPRKKAAVDTSAIRAQIKTEREILKEAKTYLKEDKAELRDVLSKSKAAVSEVSKTLKTTISKHAKGVRFAEKDIVIREKAVAKQQGVIDKLTAKLN